jgi:hypothetical protein
MRFAIITLIIILPFGLIGQQKDSSQIVNFSLLGAYIFQHENVFEISPTVYLKINKTRIGFGPSIQTTYYNHVTYFHLGGIIALQQTINKFTLVSYLSAIHRKMLGIINNTISPEIGFRVYKQFVVTVGYNYPISGELYPYTTAIRVTLRNTFD